MKKIKMFNIYHEESGEYEVKDHVTSESHVILWDGFFGKWVASERMHFHEKTIDAIKAKEAEEDHALFQSFFSDENMTLGAIAPKVITPEARKPGRYLDATYNGANLSAAWVSVQGPKEAQYA